MNLDSEQALFDACRDVPPEERERRLADCLDTALAERVRRLLAAYDREFSSLEAGAHGLSPLAMPRRVGAYQVVERIGEGAMGEVFLAELLLQGRVS